ncbi:MAG: bifunctional demethylmenaquinone methyltransferase/2-methoxy-6-polyprenyl-1,4-benzoquinol methylase UbiE [Phycisphaerae bacterium]|nr:bifunctional demethylmenaquinone methyltransferase/2-methoxy-6-polyprenyl-1,4-benzoquinol methylase UbiE [Phycisphaerae bacterium]|tara:strand:+ start:4323 stop:5117 length:795 start_codon:yes stop_codon:yes gene_type:complete
MTNQQDKSGPAWSSDDLKGNPHQAEDKAGRVRSMFDSIAGRYDLNNRLHSFGRDQAWRRAAVAMADIGPTDRVLDVACGTGDLTLALARSEPESIRGVDFSGEMLAVARRKGESMPPAAGVPSPAFDQGDAMKLDIEDGAFTVVTIAFGIRNVSDPARAIGEFHRVLAPGGRLVILEFSQPSNRLVRFGSDLYNKRIMPLTATLVSGDRSGAYRYLPRSMETFVSPEQMGGMMTDTGFTDIAHRPLTFGVCTLTCGIRPTTGSA